MWHLLHSYFQNSALYVRSLGDNAVEKKNKVSTTRSCIYYEKKHTQTSNYYVK